MSTANKRFFSIMQGVLTKKHLITDGVIDPSVTATFIEPAGAPYAVHSFENGYIRFFASDLSGSFFSSIEFSNLNLQNVERIELDYSIPNATRNPNGTVQLPNTLSRMFAYDISDSVILDESTPDETPHARRTDTFFINSDLGKIWLQCKNGESSLDCYPTYYTEMHVFNMRVFHF